MKDYSKMSLKELEAERQSLSNEMDKAISKAKAQIQEIDGIIALKGAEEKLAELTSAEREALGKVLTKKG